LETLGKTVEKHIDTEGVEIKVKRLELTVLSLNLINPSVDIVSRATVNEAATEGERVLRVGGTIRFPKFFIERPGPGNEMGRGRLVVLVGCRGRRGRIVEKVEVS
jgi:hypothetical protein